jgi:murein DD-endopeptidase
MTNSVLSGRLVRDWKLIAGLPLRIGVALGMSMLVALIGGCGAGRSYQKHELAGIDTAALIQTARGQLGARYSPGGSSPLTGFDCSGFTHWVFMQHGISLPRQSYDQYQLGQQVKVGKLRGGDLVFFEIEKKGASHVGIYVDHGWFIHCSSTGGSVREEDLNQKYWQKHFLGARRLLP